MSLVLLFIILVAVHVVADNVPAVADVGVDNPADVDVGFDNTCYC